MYRNFEQIILLTEHYPGNMLFSMYVILDLFEFLPNRFSGNCLADQYDLLINNGGWSSNNE